jgi:hypothetical protein
MKDWEQTEVETADWVKQNVPNKWVVKHFGGSNSRKPDLQIKHKINKEKMNLEIKLLPSRCGQFALKKEKNEWRFSERNNIKESVMSKKIVQYINKKPIEQVEQAIPDNIVHYWVKDYLKQKNVEAIIASTKKHSQKFVIKKDELDEYLDIKMVIRKKKSGSRVVPKKERMEAQNQILEKYPEAIFKEKNKYLIVSNFNPDNQYINDYILSPMNEGFSVRKPSKTANVTVEFVISLKENIHIQKQPEELLRKIFTYGTTVPNQFSSYPPGISVQRKRREGRKTFNLGRSNSNFLYAKRFCG